MLVSELAHNHGIINGDRAQRTKILADSKARSEGFAMLAFSDVNGKAYSEKGKDMAAAHLPLVIGGAVLLVALYFIASKLVMWKGSRK